LVAGLAIGGAIALTSTVASGAKDADPSNYEATLTINLTDRDGTVTLDDKGDDANDDSEVIETGNPCAAILPLSGRLLQFVANDGASPSTDTVQVRDSAIGILTNNTSCGSANAGTINKNESLTIDLGPYFDSAGVVAESVTLKFDRFQRGDLKVGFDGATPTERAVDGYPGELVLTPSGGFTSMTVTSTANNNAGVSVLDGTSFNLTSEFDFAVFCLEQASDSTTGEIATSAVFYRAENGTKTKGKACEDVGVTIEIQDDQVFWDNAIVGVTGTDQDVAGLVTIDFAPIPTAGKTQAEIDDILNREIDYDADGPAPFTDSLWCLSFTENLNGTITAKQPNIGVGTDGANIDGTAPWCEVENNSKLMDGFIHQTITLFGSGDPYFR
jgi:hypothetical protein